METTDKLIDQSKTDPELRILKLEEELRIAKAEIRNLQEITAPIVPQAGQIPQIHGIDIYGESIQLNGALGGDHIIFLDFKKRFDFPERIKRAQSCGKDALARQLELTSRKAGILVADVSGHSLTDAAMAGRLHDAFLSCVLYELDISGTITPRLFETLNLRFYHSTTVLKLITMIYGEVSEDGTFRFISAGHPVPVVFSNELNRIVDISPDRFAGYPPLGTQPPEYHVDKGSIRGNFLGYKQKYEVSEINLMGYGDIMVIYTDGFSDYRNAAGDYLFSNLEKLLQTVKHLPAMEIGREIRNAISGFGRQNDDITYVVIKKG